MRSDSGSAATPTASMNGPDAPAIATGSGSVAQATDCPGGSGKASGMESDVSACSLIEACPEYHVDRWNKARRRGWVGWVESVGWVLTPEREGFSRASGSRGSRGSGG